MSVTGQLTYDWGAVQVGALSDPRNPFSIKYMYVEFSNVEEAGDEVVLPTLTRELPGDYYDALLGSPCADYLRIPVVMFRPYVSDSELFTRANAVAISAITDGVAGVHGKPFMHTAISKVYGGALVIAPEPNDPSQDIIYERFYLSAESQVVKLDGQQITLSRSLSFQ